MPDDPPKLHVVATDEPGRAQDQGRRHRRRGAPSAATASLLARYQETMRGHLSRLLDELGGPVPDPGLGLDVQRPAPLKDQAARWDLAIKLARELGTEVDPAGGIGGTASPAPTKPRKWARRRVDYGPDHD